MAGSVVFAQSGPQLPPEGQGFAPGMQPGEGMPFQRLSPEEAAEKLTAEMVEALDLTDKQVKKVTKFNKKDQEDFQSLYMSNFPRPGMGGGPMGGPGMGRPGGMPGGMPGGGPDGAGMRPEGGFPMVTPDLSELESYWAKKEKKLRKILGDEEFGKWYALHPEQFGVVERPAGAPQDGTAPFLTPQGQLPPQD